MKPKKLTLQKIQVDSFVTVLKEKDRETIQGGETIFTWFCCAAQPKQPQSSAIPGRICVTTNFIETRYPPCDNGTRPYDKPTETINRYLKCACTPNGVVPEINNAEIGGMFGD